MPYRMTSTKTASKVKAGSAGATIGVALAKLVVEVVDAYFVAVPESVELAAIAFFAALVAWRLGYRTSPGPNDQVEFVYE